MQQPSEFIQLIYRGERYTLKRHHSLSPSIASTTDSPLSAVQIPRGFKCLLYRGHSYLIPCY